MDITTENPAIDTANSGKLTCEACGAEFTCSAGQESCWCFEVKVSPENLESIKENYQRCLCRECLEKTKEWRSDV